MPLRFLALALACLCVFSSTAHARDTACPAMRDDQVAVKIDVLRTAPTYYDGEGWRVKSEANARIKATGVAGLDCYYITDAHVTITMSGMTGRGPAPKQTMPDISRIRAYIASLIRRRNGVALSNEDSDRWQRTALNDINKAAHKAVSEFKD